MAEHNTANFFKWLEKSNLTEHDIIKCRKMQSFTISENSNAFGITTITASGFLHNDYIQLGPEIKQHYSETKEDYLADPERYYETGLGAQGVYDTAYEAASFSDVELEFYEDRVVLVYQEYEMGPYMYGQIRINISYQELFGRSRL